MSSRTRRIGSLALLSLILGTACFRSGPDHSVLEIAATDYAYALSGTDGYAAGRVTLRLTNAGAEEHMAALLRFNDGVSSEDVESSLADGDFGAFLSQITFAGGPNGVPAGGEQVVEQILDAGEYMLICFIETPEGVPHFAEGMKTTVRIGESDGSESAPVGSKGSLGLKDYAFDLSAATQGPGVFKLDNTGDEPHEITLLKLKAGATKDDVLANLEAAGPDRPYTHAAGIAPIGPGDEAWIRLELDPGNYLAVCFVPSPTGQAHFELGMVDELTIT